LFFLAGRVHVGPAIPTALDIGGAVHLEHGAVLGVDDRSDLEITAFLLAFFVGVLANSYGNLIHDFTHTVLSIELRLNRLLPGT